jgi:glutathione synthase
MLRLGLAITRASPVEPTWTTALIACAWLGAGHSLRVIESWDFEVSVQGQLCARAHCFDPSHQWTAENFCQALRRRTAPRRLIQLRDLDALWLRINPLNTGVLTFAEGAAALGVPSIPSALTLMLTAHKSYIASLADVPRPPTLVTRSRAAIHAFYEGLDTGMILKPARGSGGRAVFRILPNRIDNLDHAIDRVRVHGDGYLVAQQYLPEAEAGEKRLLWLNGRILGAYLRRRAEGEFRHNLAQGAQPIPCEITKEEQASCAALTPHLLRADVWLAGIDIIGSQIVEVNTLNPGGLHWIQELGARDHSAEVVASLETWIKTRTAGIPAA